MTDQIQYFENARIEHDLHTVWSIDEVTDITANAAIKVEGKTVVYETIRSDATTEELLSDLASGGNLTTVTYTETVKGNTWLSLWKAANQLILKSGTHHSYIEDFTMNDNGELELTTGS
tara:strand:+ start:45 stop:401 length:357 start_codon:yes stop_codon:yes gene_type:complete